MADLSPVTAQWESLFRLYAVIGVIVASVVIGWLTYNAIRYRSKQGSREPEDAPRAGKVSPERGTVKGAIVLGLIVTGILFPITLGTMQTVELIEHPPRDVVMVVEVHAFQFGWRFTYPSGKVVVGDLRVPKDRVVVLEVTSGDVFHNFGAYDFRVKADAIPGKVNVIWIQPHITGVYYVQCFELCGIGHALMKGRLIVVEEDEFSDWYSDGKDERS